MAHHQHHGADYDAQVSRSLQSRPNSSSTSHMPIISEDDLLADPDEPPDLYRERRFTKSIPSSVLAQRQSLLTRALSTDTESHDEHPMPEAYFGHVPSVSSTASNFSSRSNGDFTSDDGHHSPSTRASTPSSPRSVTNLPKILLNSHKPDRPASPLHHDSDASRKSSNSSGDATPEPTVEAKLGRKRCITFACGGKDTSTAKADLTPKPEPEAVAAKRPCAIKFMCPFTASKTGKTELPRASRHLSPAPGVTKTSSPKGFHRRHRDSDTTIKNESPRTPKPSVGPVPSKHRRRASNNSDLGRSDACKFHEFASSDDDVEEWTRESTCHMSRLTVTDTLKKENDIRQLAEEADEEDAMEEEEAQHAESDEAEYLSDAVSDEGFKTDDEDGFAESDDDENESDSDYEWWAPRRTRNASPFIGSDVFRPVVQRQFSDSSIDSTDDEVSPAIRRGRQRHSKASIIRAPVRPGTPELPDSTDFVCGTLDEDRPLEQAYISCLQQRKAAKHRTVPQDIDPSFPTSDPEIENDDEEEDAADNIDESDHLFMHGRPDNIDGREEPRGRRHSPAPLRSPRLSPKRLRSPPPPAKKPLLPRSPAPRALFNRSSPRRFRSPAPNNRLTSPPPSPRGSETRLAGLGSAKPLPIGLPYLGERNDNLTHTASLPRSPHPFARRRVPSAIGGQPGMNCADEDEGEVTEHAKPYTRGAMDIAQGLERKRLKRREKFYRQYLKKEEKKKSRRPQPGRGAERMRQVGLECATLRGKRMLSI